MLDAAGDSFHRRLLRALAAAREQSRAHERRERQRHKARCDDRDDDRDGKLAENATEQEIAAARQKIAAPLAYYVGKMGVYYAQMLTRNGFGEDVQAVIEGWKQGMKAAIMAVSPRMLDAVSVIGTPEEVVAKLDQWAEAGVDEPLLSMPEGTPDQVGKQLDGLRAALQQN